MDWSAELKHIAKQRRETNLQEMQDNLNINDKATPSKKEYRRNIKHRPRSAIEWEELEGEEW
jgi:hypothetical protein